MQGVTGQPGSPGDGSANGKTRDTGVIGETGDTGVTRELGGPRDTGVKGMMWDIRGTGETGGAGGAGETGILSEMMPVTPPTDPSGPTCRQSTFAGHQPPLDLGGGCGPLPLPKGPGTEALLFFYSHLLGSWPSRRWH